MVNVTATPDIDQFWKLEFIGVKEQPNVHDETALEQFKEAITKIMEDTKFAGRGKN